MLDKELLEQFRLLAGMIENVEIRLTDKMATKQYVDERARHTEILIENTITKRLDSLFDGYQTVREHQWELERKVEQLEKRLELLENKTA